ncbi:MAG: 4Fe-4S binding protein [Firmicutes bacterium]|nr:4Fe-4S binding protein [Bacillota bacterium]
MRRLEKCTGCTLCVRVCPSGAGRSLHHGRKRHHRPGVLAGGSPDQEPHPGVGFLAGGGLWRPGQVPGHLWGCQPPAPPAAQAGRRHGHAPTGHGSDRRSGRPSGCKGTGGSRHSAEPPVSGMTSRASLGPPARRRKSLPAAA